MLTTDGLGTDRRVTSTSLPARGMDRGVEACLPSADKVSAGRDNPLGGMREVGGGSILSAVWSLGGADPCGGIGGAARFYC